MKRLLVGFTALVGCVIVAVWIGRGIGERLGIDVWNLPELQQELQERLDLQDALEQSVRDAHDGLAFRRKVIDELLAGRLTSKEAAQQFLTLNKADAKYANRLREQFGVTTDEEACWRQLRCYLQTLRPGPDQVALVSRLQEECSTEEEATP